MKSGVGTTVEYFEANIDGISYAGMMIICNKGTEIRVVGVLL